MYRCTDLKTLNKQDLTLLSQALDLLFNESIDSLRYGKPETQREELPARVVALQRKVDAAMEEVS